MICCPAPLFNFNYPSTLLQSWRWPLERWVGADLPSPQLCLTCLTADLESGNRVQFLRLQWQCAAMTICPTHLVPLFGACPHCRRINWPICEATGLGRFRFISANADSPKEQDARPDLPASEAAFFLRFRTVPFDGHGSGMRRLRSSIPRD